MTVWDYKVVAGRYAVEGADVVIENPQGRTTLQRLLDHYATEGFELVEQQLDAINREAVLILRRGRGQAASVPLAAAPATFAPPRPSAFEEEEPLPARRAPSATATGRHGGGGGGGRRSKAELDRLAGE